MQTQFHHLVESAAGRSPDSPALTFKNDTLSYSMLWYETRRVAMMFFRLGLRRGERVAVFLDKRLETVTSFLGVSAAAGVFVPVNPVLRSAQVRYILENCSCRILVTTSQRLSLLKDELQECPSVELVVLLDDLGAPLLNDIRVVYWKDWMAGVPNESIPISDRIDIDLAAILYTSGSTGKPKGVMISHRNLIVGAESVAAYLANDQEDVILSILPLSFDAGFSQLTTGFVSGAHVVLVNYLLPDEVIRQCANHKVTGITAVPPLWIQLAEKAWPEYATRSMRYFASTGGRMPKTTLDALRELFPAARPFLMYGLTEAFRSTYLDPAEVDRRPDSIGKAIPNAEILIVREDGSLCEVGEQGELVHRGALVTLGYWNDPEQTAKRFKPAPVVEEGFNLPEIAVWSGDLVVRDEGGFLYFIGRNDEMIKTSGYRVSPSEIEEIAYGTGDVSDAVALGVEDTRLGQRIMLFVSPMDGRSIEPEAILAEFKKLAPLHMIPDQIVVRDSLPRTPNGKFDLGLLRNEFAL